MGTAASLLFSPNPKERFTAVVLSLAGLEAVDRVLRSKLQSQTELLTEIPSYLLELGGKRIRPILTLLVSRAVGLPEPPETVIDVAAGIELIHMATLLHDDIIDDSPVRRHHSSPYRRYGTVNTLLAGDFLLVRAFALCAHLDSYVIDATERACIDLTEGEMNEVSLDKVTHSVAGSLEIARKKTGSLFRLASECGAHLSRVEGEALDDLRSFGESLGIAFQIIDDVLDVTADESQLGKRPGTDIRERKPSLINVLWLASSSTLAKRLLTEPGVQAQEAEIEAALQELRRSPVITEAKRYATERAQDALSLLSRAFDRLPNHDPFAADGLRALVEYAVERME